MTPRRRLLTVSLAPLGALVAGCAPTLPVTLRPTTLPPDPSVVFQALLRGRPVPVPEQDPRWQLAVEPPASIAVGPDGMSLAIQTVPERRAWASPRLPLAPLGTEPGAQVEQLLWTAAVTLAERYFIVCELRFAGEAGAVLIQATPFDIQITQDSERPGGGSSVSLPHLIGDGSEQLWRLHLNRERTELRLNGAPLWILPGARLLSHVAFGETRTDPLHGGTMLLRDVVYVRRPVP